MSFLFKRLLKSLRVARRAPYLPLKTFHSQIKGQNLRRQQRIAEPRRLDKALRKLHSELEELLKKRTLELLQADRQRFASEKSLAERRRFQRLLSGLSARFLNIAPDKIDQEIEGALKAIADFFQVSHCFLIERVPQEHRAVISHAARAGEVLPIPPGGNLYIPLPWIASKIFQGETLRVPALDGLPPEAVAEKEFFRNLGVRSFLIIPIVIDGAVGYAISISSRREERAWPEDSLPHLELLGEILVNALRRKQAESAARTKTDELDRFFNLSLDILCIVNTEGRFLRLNPAAETILGYPHEELMATRLIDLIHPDDLEGTLQLGPIMFSEQKVFSFANRYRCKDGTYRWLEWSAAKAGSLIYAAARDITDRQRTEKELRQSEERLRLLSSQLLAAQETERKRIAHELHDGLAAQLAAIKYRMEYRLEKGESAGSPIALKETLEDIQTAITETRRIMANLRPSVLDDLGILPALSWYSRVTGETYPGTSVESFGNLVEEDVPENLKIVIFRVVQESVTNAVRHGKASRIKIGLEKNENWLRLKVEDNGNGFLSFKKSTTEGIGLDSMQQRVESSGGIFSITSHPGKGTAVKAEWRIN